MMHQSPGATRCDTHAWVGMAVGRLQEIALGRLRHAGHTSDHDIARRVYAKVYAWPYLWRGGCCPRAVRVSPLERRECDYTSAS